MSSDVAKKWQPLRKGLPLLVCLLVLQGVSRGWLLRASSSQQSRASPQNPDRRGPRGALALSEVLSKRLPRGLILFYLNTGSDLYDPRLALLDAQGLHIYKPEGDMLAEEFSLPQPEAVGWDQMDSFPSRSGKLSGVVLWAPVLYEHASATVVCYVDGVPKVVFQGDYVDYADLDSDGIPEILTSDYASEDAEQPERVTVWTWNGREYVKAATVPPGQVWSKQVVDAVRHAKR